MQISEKTGIPLAEVIAAVEIDAAKDEKQREAWRRYYKSIGGIAAAFMILVFSLAINFASATPAQAAPVLKVAQGQFVLCKVVKSKQRQLLRFLKKFFESLFSIFAPRPLEV